MIPKPAIVLLAFAAITSPDVIAGSAEDAFDLVEIERQRILDKAQAYLNEAPVTVTAHTAERSAGSSHDFYSEGDYWWPDPDDPDGPYVRRDGLSNPDNFVAHRSAMVRLGEIVGTLASAWIITKDESYSTHALKHLNAWFVDESTRMNPSLLYGQAIKGRVTGRSIGIIDTIHLVEVARGAEILGRHGALPAKDFERIKSWFADYLDWLTTHPYGIKERNHPNNHGVWWSTQVAAFSRLAGNETELEWIRNQFKTVYLQEMMATDGSFPAELERTKPFGYSLFVLDGMAGVAQIASTETDDLWAFELPDGRSLKKGIAFLYPYIKNKSAWPYGQDVLYWDEWPVRHPSLLFAGFAYSKSDYLCLWKSLDADPTTPEVVRNLPIRHPLLWIATDRIW